MEVVYANEEFPKEAEKMIFLVGPTPRKEGVISWRIEALRILEEMGYDGHVFVPEPRDGKWQRDYYGQIRWEKKGLSMADCILCWIPRSEENRAYTTNIEVGMYASSGKIVLGAPKDAPKMKYLRALGEDYNVPQAETLEDTIKKAMEMVGAGAFRKGGECDVPLHIWKIKTFQNWYKSQRNAGNELVSAREIYNVRPGSKKNFVFIWILHVVMYITKEDRYKKNEFILGRPDISSVLMYRKGESILDAKIIMVREFRSPAVTSDGFIHELPGGSSKNETDPTIVASDEVFEETGLRIDHSRIRKHGARQLAGTLSVHRSDLFSVEITEEEFQELKSQQGIAHGVIADSERTYVEISTMREILSENLVDWSMIGMISAVLMEIYKNE
ncbi:MAG: nucleoside 2-deoxyribosyltransferase domain-containing protein [Candidatus Paceibacterota bacterium]